MKLTDWKNLEASIYSKCNKVNELDYKSRLIASAYNLFVTVFNKKSLQEDFELFVELSEKKDLDIETYKKKIIEECAKSWQVDKFQMLETMKKIVSTLTN